MTCQRSLVNYFSQEIIDSILDNFCLEPSKPWEWDTSPNREYLLNLAALNGCSLVCRAFTPRCQYHLFSTIHLYSLQSSGERSRREAIYTMLLAKPHVASGVRYVSVAFQENGVKSMVNKEDLTQPGLLLFLRERELTSMQLFGTAFDIIGDSYPNLRGIEEDFLQPFILAASITSLDIVCTVMSASLLACFPNLAKLTLYDSEFEHTEDYRMINVPQPRPRLQTLRISSNIIIDDILRVCGSDALPLLDLSQLRVLQASADSLWWILDRAFVICAQSLEELDVSGQYMMGRFSESRDFCRSCNLARFPRLAILSLLARCVLQEGPIIGLSPFIDQCYLMATIQSPNAMQKVLFTISIKTPESLSPLRCLDVPGWDDLDARFALIPGSGGRALEINLIIVWTVVIRQMVTRVDGGESDLSYDTIREDVRSTLQTTLVPAIREKFQRVKQSPNIIFNVVIDSVSCRTVARPRRST